MEGLLLLIEHLEVDFVTHVREEKLQLAIRQARRSMLSGFSRSCHFDTIEDIVQRVLEDRERVPHNISYDQHPKHIIQYVFELRLVSIAVYQ